tara:strand:+ start:152 stop:640 length:489 start_codon:yes stop_codon:yes gene_type:complete
LNEEGIDLKNITIVLIVLFLFFYANYDAWAGKGNDDMKLVNAVIDSMEKALFNYSSKDFIKLLAEGYIEINGADGEIMDLKKVKKVYRDILDKEKKRHYMKFFDRYINVDQKIAVVNCKFEETIEGSNDKGSGIAVFVLIKEKEDWEIASLAYSYNVSSSKK